MRKLRFEVAYDGTDFSGWQVQPGLPTIQGVLQDVISSMERKPVYVTASGRTDRGAHAIAQVAAVSIENPIPADNFRRAVNRLLPPSIRINNVRETAPEFHPRFDARRKTYEYRIYREEVCPPFDRRFVYHHPYPLDEAAMVEATPLFEGEHDFTAFASADEKDALNVCKVRTVFRSTLAREGPMLIYRITGSGFLKHMVRNVVGVLIEIGKNNLRREHVLACFEHGRAIKAAPRVPASGLFLISVEYD